jgi:septal ring factor EnvC (AmiA/AmiB activator)
MAAALAALRLVLLCVAVPALSLVAHQPSAIKSDSSPIAKVVTLITEMKATVEKEAEEDKDANDKYVCWCETNEKQKVAAIKSGTQTVEELESFVQEAAGTSAKLATEIKSLASDIKEDEEALAAANELREKESEAFQASEADMKETIDLLAQSIAKLEKVQLVQQNGGKLSDDEEGDALLQVKQLVKHVQSRSQQINNVLQRDLFDVLGELNQVARREVKKQGSSVAAGALLSEVFMSKRGDASSLLEDLFKKPTAPPTGLKGGAQAKSYNSRSGPILGVLAEMKDQFMRDLGKAQKDDFTALVNFHKLSAAKGEEIAAATKQKEMKEGQLADLKSKVAQSKETIEDTQEAVDTDEKFLKTLKENCKAEAADYDAKVKAQNDEIKALGETLEALTDEGARELFSKTVNVDFLQVATSTAARERVRDRATNRAMHRLMKAGRKNNDMALVSMAVRVRLDAFKKVKEAMNKMTTQLTKQKKQEYDKWEECKKEIDETEDDIKEASETKEDLSEKHQDLVNTLEKLKDSTTDLKKQVSEMEVELKKAGEARKAENLRYQTAISDQRATVKILNIAYSKLQAFYGSRSLLQTGEVDEQPETKDYAKNENGGSVMQLIARIITDAQTEYGVLVVSEKHAQVAYTSFVKETTASIEAARKTISANEKQAAKFSAEKSETAAAQLANNGELEKLNQLLQGTHASCDYLLKNFDARQKAIGEEIDAIADAKAILSGADFGK